MHPFDQEAKEDHDIVFEVVREAFKYMPFADGDVHHLVNRLRNSDAFIPELSLVAEKDYRIVGHILLTELSLKGSTEEKKGLSLGSRVSVHPDSPAKEWHRRRTHRMPPMTKARRARL